MAHSQPLLCRVATMKDPQRLPIRTHGRSVDATFYNKTRGPSIRHHGTSTALTDSGIRGRSGSSCRVRGELQITLPRCATMAEAEPLSIRHHEGSAAAAGEPPWPIDGRHVLQQNAGRTRDSYGSSVGAQGDPMPATSSPPSGGHTVKVMLPMV